MNYKLFVEKLESVAPKADDFTHYNLSKEYISDCIDSYKCFPKGKIGIEEPYRLEILMLLQLYDCTKIRIGNVSFIYEPVDFRDFIQIGYVELDILSINKFNNEIEVRDHDSLGHIIWPCSKNDISFLECLIVCAEHFTNEIKRLHFKTDDMITLGIVNKCTEISGGDRYSNFYKMLLGLS